MPDRTQLTEALAAWDNEVEAWEDKDRWLDDLPYLRPLAEAARLLLDFPTDEQVEVAQAAMLRFGPMASMEGMRAALEAVRDTMIGDTQ